MKQGGARGHKTTESGGDKDQMIQLIMKLDK